MKITLRTTTKITSPVLILAIIGWSSHQNYANITKTNTNHWQPKGQMEIELKPVTKSNSHRGMWRRRAKEQRKSHNNCIYYWQNIKIKKYTHKYTSTWSSTVATEAKQIAQQLRWKSFEKKNNKKIRIQMVYIYTDHTVGRLDGGCESMSNKLHQKSCCGMPHTNIWHTGSHRQHGVTDQMVAYQRLG